MISTIEILYVIFKMNSFMLLWPPSWIYESHNTNFVNKWRKILGILWTSPNIWHITFCLRKQINLVIRHMGNRRCIYFGIWAQFVISITSNAFFYFYPKYIFIDNKNRSYLHLDRLFVISLFTSYDIKKFSYFLHFHFFLWWFFSCIVSDVTVCYYYTHAVIKQRNAGSILLGYRRF